ncbi:hypothetical protein GMLC_34770 [Geomonas limicola]|uniref:histidine kinase n=1 Tax=Geomonas limicola TaxID=2740186 RepID=A0A6V8NBA1_9BACT|nr:response regulator [Geomonas limicola]GFO69898.1 hypothetical protein GMLC_34770 [Geomonas limicola]
MEALPGRPKVLIVDDAPENVQLLTEMLHDDCQTISASNGLQAIKLANTDPAPDLILLDIMMPGMNGYEVCTRLKAEPKTCEIPIIFVTALTDKSEEHKGLELGGADFITRPFNSRLVRTRIRYQLEIKRFRATHDPVPSGKVLPHATIQLELAERRRLNEESSALNQELEAQLTAARADLSQLTRQHQEDQQQIAELSRLCERRKKDLELVHRELESFSYSISHDLRAPLRHLLGFSSALVEDYSTQLDETAQSYLGCITKAGHRLEQQVEALTMLYRIARQPLNPGKVDLSRMAHEIAASLSEQSPDRQVEWVIEERLEEHGDGNLLRVALEHLLSNAFKFSGKLSHARIEVGRGSYQGKDVIFVRDNGAGFDMRYAERLFGAFQRMHKEGEFDGVGIGLTTVQRIVHRLGGEVWAEAAVDGGATFYFTLSASD